MDSSETLELRDKVSIKGEAGVWTIMQGRTLEPRFQVQLGNDAATVRFVNSGDLTLVSKAEKPQLEPGFYPTRSIMD